MTGNVRICSPTETPHLEESARKDFEHRFEVHTGLHLPPDWAERWWPTTKKEEDQ